MLEAAVLILLAAVAVFHGADILSTWRGPAASLTNELYIPAASMAAGRGFVNIVPESVPGFRQFLDFQQPSLDQQLLKQEGKEQSLHQYQGYHRYLIMAVGWVWSLFGISWESMKILIILLFAVCLWEVYGISRLAMGRVAALVVVLGFAWTDTMTAALAPLRDFGKAPFILGAILLLGWIIRRPRSGRWVMVFGMTTGLLLGVGLGFRRDAMVMVPFALLVFLLAPVGVEKRFRRNAARAAAMALFACVFCASGWPILKALHERGTLAEHDTMMGFSTNADREMSLQPASYEKLYLLNDLYCSMMAYDAGRRGLTVSPEEYGRHFTETDYDAVLKGKYVQAMALRFPADMISRAYAATLSILGGIQGPGFNKPQFSGDQSSVLKCYRLFIDYLYGSAAYGAWFALIALVCLSAVNWRLATTVLLFVLFFGGYTSGQFSGRHVFHLAFAPFFFVAFLADWTLRISCRGLLGRISLGGGGAIRVLGGRIAQAGAWAACMFALLYLPLQAAAMVQRVQVDRMMDKVRQAEKDPVGCRESRWDDRVLLTPDVSDGCAGCQNEGLLVDFRTTFYAAAFAAGPDTPDVELCYEAEDFSHPATIALGPGAPCGVLYCFPVFEPTQCTGWIRFAGLAVPKEQADRFKGFYRIRTPESLDLPVNLVIPDDPKRLLHRQQVLWPWRGSVPPQLARDGSKWEAMQLQAKAEASAAEGRWSEALDLWDALAQSRPLSRAAGVGRAEALDHLDRPAEALELLEDLLKAHPGEGLACRLVDETLSRSLSEEGKAAAWRSLAGRLPEDTCLRQYAGKVSVQPVSPAQ